MLRRPHVAAVLVLFTVTVCAIGSSAAPPVVAAGSAKKPFATKPGPQPVAAVPRIVAARARTTSSGQTLSYSVGSPAVYEIDISNPAPTARNVMINQDYTGGYGVTVPANSTKTFQIAWGVALAPCRNDVSWAVWLEESSDVRRRVKVNPACTFGVPTPPLMTQAQTGMANVPGKLSYSGAKVTALPTVCNQPIRVEADVRNNTNATVHAALVIEGYPPTNFTIGAGETKVGVSTGYAQFLGGSGHPDKLHLKDNDKPNNPAVIPGEFSVYVEGTCRPTYSLVP